MTAFKDVAANIKGKEIKAINQYIHTLQKGVDIVFGDAVSKRLDVYFRVNIGGHFRHNFYFWPAHRGHESPHLTVKIGLFKNIHVRNMEF